MYQRVLWGAPVRASERTPRISPRERAVCASAVREAFMLLVKFLRKVRFHGR